MDRSPAIVVTLEVAGILERLGVPYVIGGSLASSFHGTPRATLDSDLAADLRPEHVAPFLEALGDRYYVSAERVRSAVVRGASFNVIHLATMFKVDVFVLDDEPWNRAELARRQRFAVGEAPEDVAWVASAEDTVLQKLAWYQLGRGVSDRQWGDVLGILRVQGDRLDGHYLRHMAAEMGLTDLLGRALDETAP